MSGGTLVRKMVMPKVACVQIVFFVVHIVLGKKPHSELRLACTRGHDGSCKDSPVSFHHPGKKEI